MSQSGSNLPTVLPRFIAEQLAVEIEQGRLPPGSRLNEVHLAKQFGVSRGPLREAFAILAKDELVEMRPRYGAFVIGLTPTQIGEMYELRAALLAMAVRLFTRRATELQINEFARLSDEVERLAVLPSTTPAEAAQANQAVTAYVVSIVGNSRLQDLMTKMNRQAFRFYAEIANATFDRRRAIAAARKETLAMIRSRNAEAASLMTWRNLEVNDAAVRAALGSDAARSE